MSYCFNPHCSQPHNSDRRDICNSCGCDLLLDRRYLGIKLLGKSQLALTIEAIDTKQDRLKATSKNVTKVLKILLTDYPKAVELFQREAQILGQMNHEGIPKVVADGYFSFQPQWSKNLLHCLVLEKITGCNLQQWLKSRNNQPLNEQTAQDWLQQLLNILYQLHQQQYFHRDIKPSNIILQPNGKLVLIDFGAARKITSTYLAKVGVNQGVTSIGTPGYIAPEQIDGAALPQSDFFALGRTMVHLLTGKHPQELPKNMDTGEIVWRDRVPQISTSFADLLDSMMNQLPGKRPLNVEALLEALERVKRFPHRSLLKSRQKSKLTLTILLTGIFLPSFVWSLLSLGNSFKSKIIANAPLCYDLTCINRDPIDNKCDRDSQTLTSNTGNYSIERDLLKAYRIEVRFSAACQSTWARSEAPVGSSHYIEDRQGTKYGSAVVPVDQWQRHYTDMAPGKKIQVRACADPPTGEKSCTNFVQL